MIISALLLLPAKGVCGDLQAGQASEEASDLSSSQVRNSSSLGRSRLCRRGPARRRQPVQPPVQPLVGGAVDRPLLPADAEHPVLQRICKCMKILLIDLNNYFQCVILIKLMLLLSILLSFSTFSTFCEGRKLSQLSHRPITPGFLCSSFCLTISLFQFAQKFALNRSRLKTISPNVTRPGAATR